MLCFFPSHENFPGFLLPGSSSNPFYASSSTLHCSPGFLFSACFNLSHSKTSADCSPAFALKCVDDKITFHRSRTTTTPLPNETLVSQIICIIRIVHLSAPSGQGLLSKAPVFHLKAKLVGKMQRESETVRALHGDGRSPLLKNNQKSGTLTRSSPTHCQHCTVAYPLTYMLTRCSAINKKTKHVNL